MPMLAIFAEEAAVALASELAPYAVGEAALAATALGAEALMGLGAEALGTSAIGGAEALAASEAMAANAAAGGAGAGQAGINAAQVAAQQNAAMQLANPGITGIPEAAAEITAKGSLNPATGQFINTTLPPEPVFTGAAPASVTTSPVSGFQPMPSFEGAVSGPQGASPGFFNPSATVAPGQGPLPNPQFQIAPNASQGLRLGTGLEGIGPSAPITSVLQPPSALEAGMDKAIKFAKANPFTAMTGAYMGANALGLLNPSGNTFNDKPYDGPLSRYRLSPNFQGRTANPLDFQYNPRGYAAGGIMEANAYDIPVGYDEGGPVANVPMGNNKYSPVDQAGMIARDIAIMEGNAIGPRNKGPIMANLRADSDVGRYGVPGYGDLGQFAGSFDPANVPMGSNKFSPAEIAQMAAYDTAIMQGTAPIMPRNKSGVIENLRGASDAGAYGVPGYGDLGQFAGSSGGGGSAKPGFDEQGNATMAFAKGGSLSESIEQYQKMLGGQQQAAPARSADVGIYYDQDPDTRYQDALTAAQIRQAKVNQRAYVSPPAAKRPTPLGKLDMPTSAKSKESSSRDVEAASGGIMHSSLGGYAAGGNPRLLKGPGDGMSDNIPATINGRQPARLADGEFVIPADVVSHLGNGSTEAGAKHLHAMMNRVRKARTGNPKQGKQINARKYMPK
jgi:hypothetical protein